MKVDCVMLLYFRKFVLKTPMSCIGSIQSFSKSCFLNILLGTTYLLLQHFLAYFMTFCMKFENKIEACRLSKSFFSKTIGQAVAILFSLYILAKEAFEHVLAYPFNKKYYNQARCEYIEINKCIILMEADIKKML